MVLGFVLEYILASPLLFYYYYFLMYYHHICFRAFSLFFRRTNWFSYQHEGFLSFPCTYVFARERTIREKITDL